MAIKVVLDVFSGAWSTTSRSRSPCVSPGGVWQGSTEPIDAPRPLSVQRHPARRTGPPRPAGPVTPTGPPSRCLRLIVSADPLGSPDRRAGERSSGRHPRPGRSRTPVSSEGVLSGVIHSRAGSGRGVRSRRGPSPSSLFPLRGAWLVGRRGVSQSGLGVSRFAVVKDAGGVATPSLPFASRRTRASVRQGRARGRRHPGGGRNGGVRGSFSAVSSGVPRAVLPRVRHALQACHLGFLPRVVYPESSPPVYPSVIDQLRRVVAARRCARHPLRRVMVETPPRAGPSPPHGPARFLFPLLSPRQRPSRMRRPRRQVSFSFSFSFPGASPPLPGLPGGGSVRVARAPPQVPWIPPESARAGPLHRPHLAQRSSRHPRSGGRRSPR